MDKARGKHCLHFTLFHVVCRACIHSSLARWSAGREGSHLSGRSRIWQGQEALLEPRPASELRGLRVKHPISTRRSLSHTFHCTLDTFGAPVGEEGVFVGFAHHHGWADTCATPDRGRVIEHIHYVLHNEFPIVYSEIVVLLWEP